MYLHFPLVRFTIFPTETVHTFHNKSINNLLKSKKVTLFSGSSYNLTPYNTISLSVLRSKSLTRKKQSPNIHSHHREYEESIRSTNIFFSKAFHSLMLPGRKSCIHGITKTGWAATPCNGVLETDVHCNASGVAWFKIIFTQKTLIELDLDWVVVISVM